MLKFAYLSMSQKKAIVAILDHSPALSKVGKITLAEITSITQELAAARATGGVKIGYPNWLMKANKIDRGVYQLPVPTLDELNAYHTASGKSPSAKKAAPVKVIKVKKTVKKASAPVQEGEEVDNVRGSRLVAAIEEGDAMDDYDSDEEEFNAILRENGITV